jgi:hypothetical protein
MKISQTKISHSTRPVAAGLVAGLLCLLPNLYGQFTLGSTAATGFSGQAAAASGFAAGGAVSVADTGALAVTGGAVEAAALETSLGTVLAAGASHSAVVGEGNATASEASAANVSLSSSAGFFGATTITADFTMSRATAACGSFLATAGGMAEVTGLVINGQAVAVTGAANQFVFLSDGGYVIINEQLMSLSSLTVNAVHVVDAFAGVNVAIASSTAGVTCQFVSTTPPPPPPYDFLTGGGWITGTPSGAKANFGVAGGIRNDAYWGHLNYIDHGNGMHVKATAVTSYAADPSDSDCRIIEYNVTIDGQPGTARVRACDKGEPGRNDIFEIQLSSGYFAGGDLGGSHPGGGNIQLHKR